MVKNKLDNPFGLIDIPSLDLRGAMFSVRALVIGDACPALEALASWPKEERRAILKGLRLAASVSRTELGHLAGVSVDARSGIFEIARRGGGNARLFAFHLNERQIIVCLGPYWKTKDVPARQHAAFAAAANTRKEFLKWVHQNK